MTSIQGGSGEERRSRFSQIQKSDFFGWLREPWDDQIHWALKSWLLDRLESGHYWPDPAHPPPELASRAALAERATRDVDFLQVAALYAGRPDFPLAKLVEEPVTAESVPLLPVLRY
jgi:hypothetical protein